MSNDGFAKDLTVEQIQMRIERLLDDKAMKEIDLLLAELRRRRETFRCRIITEMTDLIKGRP